VLDEREREIRVAAVDRALSCGVGSVYQPIVDMYRGSVVGFEALSRCQLPVGSNVGDLFAQAESVGRSGDLEAAAVRSALRARAAVPLDCFLSLNVGSAALANEQVLDVLDGHSSLEGVVLEIVHNGSDSTLEAAREGIEVCRAKGASIAVAQSPLDLGSIGSLLSIDPTFVKFGVDVVSGLSTSNVKLAVVDSLRHLTETLGVGLIAQGIEDLADMESLRRLGVGFGQGYLFAAPAVGLQWETHVTRMLTGETERTQDPTVDRYVEVVDELTESDFEAPLPGGGRGIGFEVLVTELREPVALLRRTGRTVENVPMSLVSRHTALADVVRAALARPQRHRFEPLVCIDDFGACLGVVRLERLMTALVGAGAGVGAGVDAGVDAGVTEQSSTVPRSAPARHRTGPHGFRCIPPRR
jgi:EAL domain-containing protein (putative c-di-GMP-specific phosphodiesterase class I)